MLVCTRFGIGVRDLAWFEHRLELFAAVTAPSLRAQEDQHFHWVLFVDSAVPATVRQRLHTILAPFEGRATLHTDPHAWASTVHSLGKQRDLLDADGYLLTGRIDDDDAWHVSTVGQVRERVKSWCRQRGGAAGLGLTFTNGLEWIMYDMLDIKTLQEKGDRITRGAAVRPFSLAFHSMSVFAYSRLSDEIAAISMPHSQSADFLTQSNFDLDVVSTERPMWLYCRHKHTVSGTQYSNADEVEKTLADLTREFGIDQTRTTKYLLNADSYGYLLPKDTDAERLEIAKDLAKVQLKIDSSALDDAQLAELEQERSKLTLQLSKELIGDPNEIASD